MMNIYSYFKGKIREYYIGCLPYGFELFDKVSKIDVSSFGELKLFNKEHFIKSEYSIIRKFFKAFQSNEVLYTHESSEEELDAEYKKEIPTFTDVFRMNIQINVDFEKGATAFLKEIAKIDGVILNPEFKQPFKDSFNDNSGSKDFKVYLSYKGYPFEIQLHTLESETMNFNTHGLYEVYRSLKNGDENKELLREDRNKLYGMVSIPDFNQFKIMKEAFGYEKERVCVFQIRH